MEATVAWVTSGVVRVVAEERVERLMVVEPPMTMTSEEVPVPDEMKVSGNEVGVALVRKVVVGLEVTGGWVEVGIEVGAADVPGLSVAGVVVAGTLVEVVGTSEVTEFTSEVTELTTSETGRLVEMLMPVPTWRLNMMPSGMFSGGNWAKEKRSPSMAVVDQREGKTICVCPVEIWTARAAICGAWTGWRALTRPSIDFEQGPPLYLGDCAD